ncbi:MAG: PHP domain-containing protein [Chloroflexi bacterium]|nr:PHP domain-containing protein [Chloroflexota bacterium]
MHDQDAVPDGWGRADLHVHSAWSDGLDAVGQILEQVAEHTALDVVAITDHDDVRGALEARDLAAQRGYRFEVVPGVEVTTREGHVLALFVERPISMLRSVEWTLDAVHAQGGLAIVPHPMSWLILSVGQRALRRVAGRRNEGVYFDGIELAGPSWAGRVAAQRAADLNATLLHLPALGGSDAHSRTLVGTAVTRFAGRTADELRRAIAAGETQHVGRHWTVAEHLHGLPRQLWRSMIAHPTEKAARSLRVRLGSRL